MIIFAVGAVVVKVRVRTVGVERVVGSKLLTKLLRVDEILFVTVKAEFCEYVDDDAVWVVIAKVSLGL